MVSDRKLANAVGGKTARACDNCIKKRARWYCPADDAFLCQSCDASVHSANPLARRHERVRLKTSSLIKPSSKETHNNISLISNLDNIYLPSWHRGFTKKARTPRQNHAKSKEPGRNPLINFVPEMCSEENSHEENDEKLLYRVPIFDPFVAELCSTSANSNEAGATTLTVGNYDHQFKPTMSNYDNNYCINDLNHQLHGISLPSEMDLGEFEFAADVESLLGKGLDDESFDIEGLGLSDCKEEKDLMENSLGSGKVKVEDDGETEVVMSSTHQITDAEIDMTRETFEFNFDYDSQLTCEEDNKPQAEEMGEIVKNSEDCNGDNYAMNSSKKILLRLDYEGVITAWADQRSPWTTGERPELDFNNVHCSPDCMGFCGAAHHPYGDVGIFGYGAIMDGGREARVSRYREKRRTRLFSKKIRYEVRKLNAEKRPRMKGRFVKRANFSGQPFPLHNNK